MNKHESTDSIRDKRQVDISELVTPFVETTIPVEAILKRENHWSMGTSLKVIGGCTTVNDNYMLCI